MLAAQATLADSFAQALHLLKKVIDDRFTRMSLSTYP
jgi:hypothetical protein